MKQSILVDIGRLQDKQMGFVVSMTYQYSQLCVKADPTLLLGVVFNENGMERNIEDLAQVMVYGEEEKDKQDIINLVPLESNDTIPILQEGISDVYPEIIQTVESLEPAADDPVVAEQRKKIEQEYGTTLPTGDRANYLQLRMPEVDDDRKDLLDDAVKVIHDAIKARMDAVKALYTSSIAVKSAGETPEELKAIEDQLEQVNKQYDDLREQFTDNKLKDIKEANDRYHQKHPDGDSKLSSAEKDQWKSLKVQ